MENADYDVFEAEMARDWANALISHMNHRRTLDKLNSQIETTWTPDYIQIHFGIDILADLLRCELLEGGRIDEYTEYYFIYQDVKFLELSRDKLGRYANGTDR